MVEALFIYRTSVLPSWVDYNGHMGDYAYGIVFSDAATAYMDRIGIDAVYREKSGATLYTLDSRIGYMKECHAGELLRIELSHIDADRKRIHIFMRMLNAGGERLALCEQLLMHVSRADGSPRASDMPDTVQQRVSADLKHSRFVEKPDWIDNRIGLRKQNRT
ncbi:thioesterase family protein [Brucella rhizosphaerae]|uniref:Thioesterase-like superfamily protein n=1 Tax=Brucella rhizosphaerae TaxID=571254 RepID=A0A256FB84_9HYPH|nr:thioesterase family protein [Brucella rhizosphaerae]OYR12127.1 thioesterase-like superfamily protein [Brucella rhizosphaerae]